MKNRIFSNLFERINRKRRVSLRDGHNDKELWYIYLSPLNIFTGSLALLLILLLLIVTLVAYTPLLDLIPGYPGNRSRELLVENIMRLDSMERQINDMQIYGDNMLLVLDGKTPTTRSINQSSDSARYRNQSILPAGREDSLLRREIESGALLPQVRKTGDDRKTTMKNDLVAPLKGVVVTGFSPKDNHFGVSVATASDQQISAAADGTVILSMITPTEGQLLHIQHSDNLISVYKNVASSLKTTGARVKAGDVIGYTGEGGIGEGKGSFGFELWYGGLPVNPENYVVF